METIIALDFASAREAFDFLKKFDGESVKPYVKIGMELFYAEGPAIVKEIKRMGHGVFLDLKMHDIPNTVKKAMKVISESGADIVNLHAAGGRKMMEAALEGLTRADGTRPLLIAVTQLTSTSEEMLRDELHVTAPMKETIISYARNAREAGLDGVVCSPLEVEAVKAACGDDFIAVTPGIRFADSAKDDQVRITTPERAGELGSDFIVVGRPITLAADPVEAWKRTLSK